VCCSVLQCVAVCCSVLKDDLLSDVIRYTYDVTRLNATWRRRDVT